MKLLKNLCILGSLVLIAAALTGIQSVSIRPSGTTIIRFGNFGRIFAFAEAFVFAAFAYGIHIRVRITWKVGFVLLALGYINLVVGAVAATYHAALVIDIPSFWLPTCLIVVIGAAVGVCWGLWWKRQRSYFP
jgi:hypothetical protein